MKLACLYIKRTESGRFAIVGVYFNDLSIVGHPELVFELKNALSKRFQMSELGPVKTCIGISITRDNKKGIMLFAAKKSAVI